MDSWKDIHPERWTNTDLLNFIYSLARMESSMDLRELRGERFQGLTGRDVCTMLLQDFLDRDSRYGALLFSAIEDLKRRNNSKAAAVADSCIKRELELLVVGKQNHSLIPDSVEQTSIEADTGGDIGQDMHTYVQHNSMKHLEGDLHILRDCYTEKLPIISNTEKRYTGAPNWDFCSYTEYLHHGSTDMMTSHLNNDITHFPSDLYMTSSDLYTTPHDLDMASCNRVTSSSDVTFLHARFDDYISLYGCEYDEQCEPAEFSSKLDRHCYSTINASILEQEHLSSKDHLQNVARRKEGKRRTAFTSRGSHLWEFLCDLLRCGGQYEEGGERLIQWEDRGEGVFRILNSKRVAELWGKQKHNNKMTYEKLSRALRWCRTYGFLTKLPKEGNFPKRLCFKFGPRATNWQL